MFRSRGRSGLCSTGEPKFHHCGGRGLPEPGYSHGMTVVVLTENPGISFAAGDSLYFVRYLFRHHCGNIDWMSNQRGLSSALLRALLSFRSVGSPKSFKAASLNAESKQQDVITLVLIVKSHPGVIAGIRDYDRHRSLVSGSMADGTKLWGQRSRTCLCSFEAVAGTGGVHLLQRTHGDNLHMTWGMNRASAVAEGKHQLHTHPNSIQPGAHPCPLRQPSDVRVWGIDSVGRIPRPERMVIRTPSRGWEGSSMVHFLLRPAIADSSSVKGALSTWGEPEARGETIATWQGRAQGRERKNETFEQVVAIDCKLRSLGENREGGQSGGNGKLGTPGGRDAVLASDPSWSRSRCLPEDDSPTITTTDTSNAEWTPDSLPDCRKGLEMPVGMKWSRVTRRI
ncbi:hypothetical protein BDQ94DRAFT_160792 [Aspergillus welwitschiae]|uniref:Uncharacterized protein n=1 Tax=Aspergillus welwitschiae TaxID=1341132 RepID=A0A3F3PWE9_9EURO|nr:hypothetical protein BDQ94DRAFT_160792 [Aspergillus welwitschiae]RDH31213.1 hypothetical protein BDQ94DRAFT_160792 [Aspergillus welwitschiae]